ncbi:hypothetical protein RO3G_00784 [Rhizopus delemar RA 99-880]|uniref:Uncharacterized protein n=1 Tax=Rhizopus delemar (strain RA 99-880 / ATCC MYA-4621 / FGSC 9543 / NRRL 43880) TaxID=246409 RepID=I1BIQ0_RHIO9|nr:hypothetical protein RO3G_00784 [Rhizopus delemar RA 99-880]|eukprot:EIE76080.1 hypothetical protein RO3G_00784 [Rhizopus delemar RA 99-880]
MIQFSQDVMIKPAQTSWFWVDDEDNELVPLESQSLYREDWLGLKKLNEAGRLEFLVCPGQHCPTTEYSIVVEHFAQLIATHWQFDHLEPIISNTYRTIAEQFQKHIQITTQKADRDSTEQHFFRVKVSSDDRMDLDILHAQIFGAIQAHTEGNLPLAWDRLADKLGRPALESYIKNKTLEHCPLSSDLVSSVCLQQRARQLSSEMEDYIHVNLENIYNQLDNQVLPELLQKTSQDLVNVLNYFNRIFSFRDNERFSLSVIPWKQEKEETSLKSKLIPLLLAHNDDHPTDFFSHYACLSRA